MSDQKLIDAMLTLQTSIEVLSENIATLNSVLSDGETLRDFKFAIDDFTKAIKEYKEVKES